MKPSAPHFLLVAGADPPDGCRPGRWHFHLQTIDGRLEIEASDEEPWTSQERLQLLAVVRGLEALPGPSRVTLVTTSRQIDRGLRGALETWRGNGWRWEAYGRQVEIKHADLWQRVDRALAFHQVRCRMQRIDAPHRPGAPPALRPVRTGLCRRLWASLCCAVSRRSPRLSGHWLGHPAW